MLLDLVPSDQEQWAKPKPNEQARLPVGFGEGFDTAWNENNLFGQSVARTNARMQALDDYVNEVRQKTGKDIAPTVGEAGEAGEGMMWMAAQQEAKKLGLTPPTDDEITERAALLSRQARTQYADVAAREKAGGGAGLFVGGLAGATTDPINVLAAPVGGGEGGILMTALKFGAATAATQAGNEALQAGFRERVQPGYAESGEAQTNILMAGAQGAALGGGTKALGNLWTRVKTGTWPTSVRDAGNLLESEANVQQTNVYPGVQGEVAHREALGGAIDNIIKGEPVDVSRAITPEVEASAATRLAPIIEARAEAQRITTIAKGVPDEDFIKKIGTGETDVPTVEELQKAISATREADIAASGMDEKTYRELERLNRQIDQGSDTAIARKNEILAGLPPEGEGLSLPDIDQMKQLSIEFSSLEKQSAESLPEFEDGIARVLKRYISAFTDGDSMARAVFRKAFVEAQRHGLDTKKLGNDVIRRFLGDLSESDQKFMRQEFAQFLTKKIAPQPELPFEQSAAEAKAESATGVLAERVAAEARRAGYDMPSEEAAQVAARMVKAPDEQVAQTLDRLVTNPSLAAEAPTRVPREAPTVPLAAHAPEEAAQLLGSPDHEAAIRADIDRARMTGDVKIPAGVDEKGEPIFRSLDAAMDEVDGYKAAADEIKACANPAPEPEPANG